MVLKFQTYVDDSYSDEEFILGGHIATVHAWANFSKEWNELLPRYGTLADTGVYHFKMSEMAQSPERMERVPIFSRVIENNVAASVSIRFNVPEYRESLQLVKNKYERFNWFVDFAKWEHPFVLAYRGLMDGFHIQRLELTDRIPLDAQVDFIFDNQTEKNFLLAEWDTYIAKRDEDIRALYGAKPRFEDDQKFLPLQAADFWAWWVREWYEEDSYNPPTKMVALDFGKWHGIKRPLLALAFSKSEIIETLENVAMEHGKMALAERQARENQ